MTTMVVAAQFTENGGEPSTGLTLAEIDLYLTRLHNTTGVDSVVWNGTQNPTEEIDNCGNYMRLYTDADLDTYTYFVAAEYTGATTLDADFAIGSIGDPGFWGASTRTLTSASTAPGTGLTAQVWTVYRGDTLERSFATIAADATITKVQLTVKSSAWTDVDTAAVLMVDSVNDLVYLNGAAPAGAYTGTFDIAGDLAIIAATMSQLEPAEIDYDVQVWRMAAVETIEIGVFKIVTDASRSTTVAP